MKHNEKQQKIIDECNKAIAELVYEKTKLIKAYNYYHGKRDPDQFRHLEENYGIGTPTSVEFVPLTRKHIDVLVGEYLTIPTLPRVSCKDKETIGKILEEKKSYLNDELESRLSDYVKDLVAGAQTKSDKNFIAELKKTREQLDRAFISSFEIASQNVMDWAIQNREIDFINKRRIYLTDLLISGSGYTRVLETENKEGIDFRVLNPLHTFIERNHDAIYSKSSQRGVIRDFLSRSEILQRYGKYFGEDELDNLDKMFGYQTGSSYIQGFETVFDNDSDGVLAGYEAMPYYDVNKSLIAYRRIPVYDVEYLQTDKEKGKYITNRYRCIRIGTELFIPLGKVENVYRPMSDPTTCYLSINGSFHSDRNGEPFSLILATANLQDKFDILWFYRDNLIAESGTVGDWIDLAFLPKLGSSVTESLMKWKAYKKQGLALIDSSLEGMAPMNTTFGGYDDTITSDAVQAIDLAIQRVEETCSTITGVFREKLGGIEQNDAVTNVQVGIRQSTYITKQIFYSMDGITREILSDILNTAKIVFKKGITGSIVLGDLKHFFTALPEHFTASDHDVHIMETSEAIQEMETIKQLGFEFVKNNNIDPEIILEVLTTNSLTKTKEELSKAIRKKREEDMNMMEMQQQLEQAQQQIQQMEQQLQQAEQATNQAEQARLQLEQKELEMKTQTEWAKINNKKEFDDKTIELKNRHIEAEVLELYDSNPNNDEVKNI